MKVLRYILLLVVFLLVGSMQLLAQSDRYMIRQGNRKYKSMQWAQAETQYRKALSKNSNNPQAVYNLGCALLMQKKDSMAFEQFVKAAKMEPNKLRRAKSYHNMGCVMQGHREYAKAIQAYEWALMCNPNDNQTRYNLALCKKLLKNNPQQNQNNQNKNNKDKNKNKNQSKDQQNKNGKDSDKNKDKNQDKNKNQNKNQQNEQNKDQMSKDNAEQLLNAAIQQEQATKQKMQKAMSQPKRKAYDKNW